MKKNQTSRNWTSPSAIEIKRIDGINYLSESTFVSICGNIFQGLAFGEQLLNDFHHKHCLRCDNKLYYKLDSVIEFVENLYENCDEDISKYIEQLVTAKLLQSMAENSLNKLYELYTPDENNIPFSETVPF